MRSGLIRSNLYFWWILLFAGCPLFAPTDEILSAEKDFKGTLKGFSFEIPNKDGTKCAIIQGSDATTTPGGIIEIASIKTKVFSSDGREFIISSESATFNKNAMEVTTEAPVKMVSQDINVAGIGLKWTPNNKLIEVKGNVKVEINVKREGQVF